MKKVNNETEDKSKENKYLQLFNAFFELLKNYENKEINFKEIVEDENFRKLVNSNDYGNIDLNMGDNSNKIMIEEEKELNDIENMEEYSVNYAEDCFDNDNYEDCFEDQEENEDEIDYEDDLEEDYNDEDLEEECIYAINENKKKEQNEQNENEEAK